MRQEYRRITIGFSGEAPTASFRIPGIEHIHASGRQLDVIASANANAIVEEARRAAAVSVDVAPIGLRDLFLEKVRHGDGEEQL